MVFLKRQRARIIAGALIAALIVPVTVASADYWRGRRINTGPSGGFFIDRSAQVIIDGADIAQIFRNSAQKWRSASIGTPGAPSVATNFIELPNGGAECDVYYAQPAYRAKDARLRVARGLTRIYGILPNGEIDNLDSVYSDRLNGVNKHGNGCGHDRAWKKATVTLYTDSIRAGANGFNNPPTRIVTFGDVAQNTAVHEIGHTLKLAHSPTGDLLGDGTENRNDLLRAGELRTLMENRDSLPFMLEPQPYDKRQLQAKWRN